MVLLNFWMILIGLSLVSMCIQVSQVSFLATYVDVMLGQSCWSAGKGGVLRAVAAGQALPDGAAGPNARSAPTPPPGHRRHSAHAQARHASPHFRAGRDEAGRRRRTGAGLGDAARGGASPPTAVGVGGAESTSRDGDADGARGEGGGDDDGREGRGRVGAPAQAATRRPARVSLSGQSDEAGC